MSFRRFALVFWLDLRVQLKRPLFWMMVILAFVFTWGLSTGDVTVGSGDSQVGGVKAHITSQFAQALHQGIFALLAYGFFFAVACGLPVIRDEEENVLDILHSTPLKPIEYVLGKFLAPFVAFCLAYGSHLLLAMFFNHVVPNAEAEKFHGPLHLGNYLVPAVAFVLPLVLFLSGVAFFLGERTRKPILVFLVPVAVWTYCLFGVLAPWLPEDLSPGIDRVLQLVDPSGFRWLNQTWLKVDRGVAFYNSGAIGFDLGYILSRIGFASIGLAGVWVSAAGFGQRLRRSTRTAKKGTIVPPLAIAAQPRQSAGTLAELAMSSRETGFAAQVLEAARVELRGLRSQPGLYIFVPLILVQAIVNGVFGVGWLDTPLLVTAGSFMTRAIAQISFWGTLLLMFYTVESLRREPAVGIAPLIWTSRVRTVALLAGKALANSVSIVAIAVAAFLGGAIVILAQGKTPLELRPFLLLWVCLVVPTLLVWSAFVSLVFCLTKNRYATYGVCLVVLGGTGYLLATGKGHWLNNWPLWGSIRWSDIAVLEFDRAGYWLSRLAALALAVFLIVMSIRFYPRIERDAQRTLHRLMPATLLRASVRPLLLALPALLLITALGLQAHGGFQGGAQKVAARQYRQRNFITWFEAPVPDIAAAQAEITIDPDKHSFQLRGSYRLVNRHEKALPLLPVTPGWHWTDPHWTLDGKDVVPEDRAGLKLFALDPPLQGDRTVTLGFAYGGEVPRGISKNGGGAGEFILPSSVVLTSFGPTFMPQIGFGDDIGAEDEASLDKREYPDDAYLGITPSGLGGEVPFPVKLSITGPKEMTFNGVGTKTSDTVNGDQRTVVWESDYPINFFNIVGGRWQERVGTGTRLFYDPKHPYNIEEMGGALDAARRYYSEWFYPYPWKELKVSEFAGIATYAQGFATNITFSESIGFLAKSNATSHAAFLVIAHESAHQWWGNILTPGKLPGGNLLSEGTSHFSTVMLIDQVLGLQARLETLKKLEEQYGRDRVVDSERPLVKIDGSRNGDTTVTYDKTGWVLTMLQQLMGREQNLAGIRAFFERYVGNRDHPVLQDFVETLRPFATDPTEYDAFVKQWFFEVVVPEYKLVDVKKERMSDGRWHVTGVIQNVGTGRMPVEVAAAKAERFTKLSDEERKTKEPPVSPDYKDQRQRVVLGAAESAAVDLTCDFEPDRVEVDPDVRVLQLRRSQAVYKF